LLVKRRRAMESYGAVLYIKTLGNKWKERKGDLLHVKWPLARTGFGKSPD